MWSSRLFWRLFITYAALHLAATLVFILIVSGWHQDRVVTQIRQRLHDSAALVASDVFKQLEFGRTTQLQERVKRLGEVIDTRITLVDMNGEVLADSNRSDVRHVATMENHINRPELIQAAADGQGFSQRTSPTLTVLMLYVALRVDSNGRPVGLVRTAVPITEVQAQVATIHQLIWPVAALVSLALLASSYFVAVRLVRPVNTLKNAAEAIADGVYLPRVYLHTRDELGALAGSFNRMSEQLKARESQLRESSQRLATVLEGMAEGVIALDDRQRITLANAAAGRLLDFSPTEALGRPLLEVVRNRALDQALVESKTGSRSKSVEIEFGGDDSRVLSVNASILSEELATRFILVLQDITDLRRLESLRQEFVANVSHELKTPLSAIKACAETLSSGAIHDPQNNAKFVQHIEEQAERLHQLILDLLSLARIESGQQAFDIRAVQVSDVVRICFGEYQAAANAQGIRLHSRAETPDLQVRADEEGTRQILTNLIDNAIKYTPKDGEVSVVWRQQNSQAVIEVRDTGVGIPAEHLPRVFERFYRVDKARARQLGGTGLGLSIVKHLAQSFGGGVEVESCPGAGSTFTVRLPRA